MENDEIDQKTESNDLPTIIIGVCMVNFLYLGYLILVTIAVLPFFESKSLLYFSILTSLVGIISNVGLFLRQRWALYAYTITCIINLIASFTVDNLKPLSVIICVIVLFVIWKNEDKIVEKNKQVGDEPKEMILKEQNETAKEENKNNNLSEKLKNSFNSTEHNEFKAKYLSNLIRDWNKIKERLYTQRNRLVIPILCIWTFLNTILLLQYFENKIAGYWGDQRTPITTSEQFYPFTSFGNDIRLYDKYNQVKVFGYFDLVFYDYLEYFVYVGGAWMIYFLYRYLKGSN